MSVIRPAFAHFPFSTGTLLVLAGTILITDNEKKRKNTTNRHRRTDGEPTIRKQHRQAWLDIQTIRYEMLKIRLICEEFFSLFFFFFFFLNKWTWCFRLLTVSFAFFISFDCYCCCCFYCYYCCFVNVTEC